MNESNAKPVELGYIPPISRPKWVPDGWEMESHNCAYRDFWVTEYKQIKKRLKLTANGCYLVERSNSWMFDKPESALAVAEIIAADAGGWVE